MTCARPANGAHLANPLSWRVVCRAGLSGASLAIRTEARSMGKTMANIPKRVAERLVATIKRYQPILGDARKRDVGEADTVTIVKDMLADVFGYDKYTEVTSEYAIRGTYCDLATRIDGVLQALIEVKAIGLDLKDAHSKQAVDTHVSIYQTCAY